MLGGLLTMASAVRVLYPAMADNWQMSAAQIGFLYAAIPLGAAIGALTSGKLAHSARPGLLMLLSTLGSFLAIGLFGLMPMWILGVVCLALVRLAERGQLTAAIYNAANANPGSDVRAD